MPRKLTKFISLLLCFCFVFQQTGFAQVVAELDISSHFLALRNSFVQDKFRPLHLRYLAYDNLNNNFNLLLDKGDFEKTSNSKLQTHNSKLIATETMQLLNYFFIGISLPNEAFWVNLRPDSPDNIIDNELAQTDVGKIFLEADLQLKKDTAQFTSPQTPNGKEYWDKLYKKAEELYGSESITIPTLTRPWIVPDEIIIRETPDNAYIYKATLKVLLEQDYLRGQRTEDREQNFKAYEFKDERSKMLNEYSTQLIRELIIPKLTKEVNTSKRYAPLRQVYYSLILAQWFKQRFYGKGGLYSYLIDKHNLNGLTSKQSWSKTTYFNAYKQSFQQGEYNIKEPTYTPTGQVIRSYMSGGLNLNCDSPIRAGSITGNPNRFSLLLNEGGGVNPKQVGVRISGSPLVAEPFNIGNINIQQREPSPSIEQQTPPTAYGSPTETASLVLEFFLSLARTFIYIIAPAVLVSLTAEIAREIKTQSIIDRFHGNRDHDMIIRGIDSKYQITLRKVSPGKIQIIVGEKIGGSLIELREHRLFEIELNNGNRAIKEIVYDDSQIKGEVAASPIGKTGRKLSIVILSVLLIPLVWLNPVFSQGMSQQVLQFIVGQGQSLTVNTIEKKFLLDLIDNELKPGVNYRWYQVDDLAVYYIEFSSFAMQNKVFNRLGQFVESANYSGRILTNDELKEIKIKTPLGHDYKIEDMCRFYTEAEQNSISLNQIEQDIRNDLIKHGFVIREEGGKYAALKKIAVISSTPEVTSEYGGKMRIETLLHERRHGLFMTEPFIYERVMKAWRSLSKGQQEYVTRRIRTLADWNPDKEELIASEVYALVMDRTVYIGGNEIIQELRDRFKKMEDEWRKRELDNYINDWIDKWIKDKKVIITPKEDTEDKDTTSSPVSQPESVASLDANSPTGSENEHRLELIGVKTGGGKQYWDRWNPENVRNYTLVEYLQKIRESSGHFAVHAGFDDIPEEGFFISRYLVKMLKNKKFPYLIGLFPSRAVHFSIDQVYSGYRHGRSMAFVCSVEALMENKVFLHSPFEEKNGKLNPTEDFPCAGFYNDPLDISHRFDIDSLGILFVHESQTGQIAKIKNPPKRIFIYSENTLGEAINNFKNKLTLSERVTLSGEIVLSRDDRGEFDKSNDVGGGRGRWLAIGGEKNSWLPSRESSKHAQSYTPEELCQMAENITRFADAGESISFGATDYANLLLDEAIRANPNLAKAYLLKGRVADNDDEKKALLEKALQLYSYKAGDLENLSWEEYKLALSEAESWAKAYASLGEIYLERMVLSRAMQCFRQADKIYSEFKSQSNTKDWIAHTRALMEARRRVKKTQSFSELKAKLGDLLEPRGRGEGYATLLEVISKLDNGKYIANILFTYSLKEAEDVVTKFAHIEKKNAEYKEIAVSELKQINDYVDAAIRKILSNVHLDGPWNFIKRKHEEFSTKIVALIKTIEEQTAAAGSPIRASEASGARIAAEFNLERITDPDTSMPDNDWIKAYLRAEELFGDLKVYKENLQEFLNCGYDAQKLKKLRDKITEFVLPHLQEAYNAFSGLPEAEQNRYIQNKIDMVKEIETASAEQLLLQKRLVNKRLPSASSIASVSPAVDSAVGGIDMRSLPQHTVVQKISAVSNPNGISAALGTGSSLQNINLNEEWRQIQNMINAGIIPSCERIKEYLEACCVKEEVSTEIDKVLACIADILRLEEEQTRATESGLRELLVLLESDKPAQEIQLALANITVMEKEPELVEP